MSVSTFNTGSKFVTTTLASAVLGLALTGCGGGEETAQAAPAAMASAPAAGSIQEGRFLDSAVSNVRYITLDANGNVSMSGFTAEDGSFFYRDGETVSFYIGDVLLGSAAAKNIVTPVSLVEGASSGDALSNMLRFLQTLDSDATPSNGIQIEDIAHSSAVNLQVDFDQAMNNFDVQESLRDILAMATNSPSMPTVISALTHFRETLLAAYDTNAGDTVLDLVNTRWTSTLTSGDCPDSSARLSHTFNLGGHSTRGYHDLTVSADGSCKSNSYGVLMAFYENDELFSCANGCTLTDLNRTVTLSVPEAHQATLIHEPGTRVITIVHEYDDGREVIETMTRE